MMPLHARAIISTPRPCLPAHRALPQSRASAPLITAAPILASHAEKTRSTGQIGIID
ncbi:hypothetical protein SLEP1_g44946 [Rubroshorea leprosula]|uniref:Uncharacterized protein n=1 Tax=Rubroshorea leprosula TaxID=152421 RepID=A0AAV5LHK6_9ROSI|nr:hypothetical protein SLEP1_g44946 [Rubroshorea leprosula]